MVLSSLGAFLGAVLCAAGPLPCDLAGYRPQPGLAAVLEEGALTVRWDGERGEELRARFGIQDGTPTILELAVRAKDGPWQTLGETLVPVFRVTTGVRRTGHGLPEENRWDVFWDAPLNHPEEVRRSASTYHAVGCSVRTEGTRLEVTFPGLELGTFSGRLQFTVYRGSSLLRQEAIARTAEPSVAYKYEGGLSGLDPARLPRVAWNDVLGRPQTAESASAASGDHQQVVLRARNRLAIATGANAGGSIAVFPPPHQFFFARELEVNLGYVYFARAAAGRFELGIRQGETAEGYRPEWIEKVFSLYNAPPGTWQRMAVYFLLSAGDSRAARQAAMDYTHGDRFKPLPGYRTMVTHFHTAFTQELLDSGSLDTTPPWIPMMRDLGINIAHIFDFHGDGHPHDPGPLRAKELEAYYEGCRRHSDAEFLILPGEEANAYLGGHYNIVFPQPVYWTMVRRPGQPLVEERPGSPPIYHAGSAADVYEIMRRTGALVWQTHPRTKGSTGYPDKIRETDYFRSREWLGAAFKALPVDLSQQRLGEVRCFGTLDDMNNWSGPKFMLGEVDTYKKFPDYDLYGDFNVNYVKLERVPGFPEWSVLLRALRAGDFFVSTGEVLIPSWRVEGRRSGAGGSVVAELEWTFPLEFLEVVWGDGQHIDRTVVTATASAPFGTGEFRIPLDASRKKWVRFAAWDSAGNGAFTQPLMLP
jgi:hypothetical protein